MSPLAILQDIMTVAQSIYSQVRLVESNQNKLATLAKTVQVSISALEGLATLPNNKHFIEGLTEFHVRVKDTYELVNEIANMNYAMRFIKAGSNLNRIDTSKQSIIEIVSLLVLGFNSQQLLDKEQDRRDEAADKHYFILQQEQSLRKAQSGSRIAPHDFEIIVNKQVTSFQHHLETQLNIAQSSKRPILPERLMVNLYDIVFEQKINESDFGSIYQGVWQEQSVTIKCFDHLATETERLQFTREAQMMSHLNHETIAHFYGACLDVERMCLLTSIMEKGNLQTVLPFLSFSDRLTMAKDLARGLAYLHGRNIIIGDIHPKHIGVNQDNKAKWTDFGLAKIRAAGIATLDRTSDEAAWQAPESWQNRASLTTGSDIYSFGILVWTLITGKFPYADTPSWEVMQLIKRGKREVIPSEIPETCSTLIKACWSPNVAARPTASQVAQALQLIDEAEFRPPSPTGLEDYERGVIAEKAGHMTEAYEAYKRSSEKKYFKSFTSLGLFLLQGLGGQEVNKGLAQTYLEQAAADGHGRAMFNLGRMVEKGDNETQTVDIEKALFWYEKALKANPTDIHCIKKVKDLKKRIK